MSPYWHLISGDALTGGRVEGGNFDALSACNIQSGLVQQCVTMRALQHGTPTPKCVW